MKLKKGFVTYKTDGKQLMVAAGPAAKLFHGLVRSNETAAFIVDHLKKETTPEQITDAMAAEYDAPKERIAADVDKIISQLRSIGAIDE